MSHENNWLLISGILLAAASFGSFLWGKHKASVALLVLAALFIRLFIAHLDPFLHDWDERFHALVARNMMDNPFKPMLNPDTVVPLNYTFWTENHIWLHKQPLFMWQMALSMKIFGVSEFTMRYPSAIMGAIMVFFLYRITWLLAKDCLLAYAAAVLMCFSNYQLELISGFIGMDHNDVAFGFYVLASIWAYIESLNSKSLWWVVLVGLFAGCAVLNKWLTGLLVFGGWGLNILITIKNVETKKEILRLLLAFAVCVVVFLPWQLYILHAFPNEARNEYAYNSKHVFEAVENHAGDALFYYHKFPQYFGLFTWWIVLIGMVVYTFSKVENQKSKIVLGASFLAVFLFFSLVVKTKMQSYLFVVGPIGYIFMAFAIVKTLQLLRAPVFITYIGLIVCAWYLFNYEGIVSYFHNPNDAERASKIKDAAAYKELNKHLLPGTRYVLNTGQFEDVELMFYNKDIIAYHGNMEPKSIELLKQTGLRVGFLKNRDRYTDADRAGESSLFYIIDQ